MDNFIGTRLFGASYVAQSYGSNIYAGVSWLGPNSFMAKK